MGALAGPAPTSKDRLATKVLLMLVGEDVAISPAHGDITDVWGIFPRTGAPLTCSGASSRSCEAAEEDQRVFLCLAEEKTRNRSAINF